MRKGAFPFDTSIINYRLTHNSYFIHSNNNCIKSHVPCRSLIHCGSAGCGRGHARAAELLQIAANCRRVPENPPRTFYEAMQFLWFVQVGGILSENPLSLNPSRFDQYMDPYYEKDIQAGILQPDFAQELVNALWLKYSEWVWTISANTADYFAGYNQFQNLTVGGKTRSGVLYRVCRFV